MQVFLALSGGIDSTVLLSEYVKHDDPVNTFFFDYGSKHNSYERKAVENIIALYRTRVEHLPFEVIDLRAIVNNQQEDTSSLLKNKNPVPEGHYEAPEMKSTVVPGRNMLFVSILAGIAQSYGGGIVAFGAHRGDSLIYPDCRPEWVGAMNNAVRIQTDNKVNLEAPFLNMIKSEIVGLGIVNGIPFEATRTCYKDQAVACGKCGSCQERLESFHRNKEMDPAIYNSRELISK